MPVALPPEHLAVSFHMTAEGVTGELVNTIAFSGTNRTDPVVQNGLDMIATEWANNVVVSLSSGLQFLHTSAIWNDDVLGPVVLDTLEGARSGSAGGQFMPLNVAMIIQKTTAFAGRKFRGRMFLGGFATTAMSSVKHNEISDSFFTLMESAFATFLSQTTADGWVPVLLHQTGGPTPTLITSLDPHRLVATMRKRIR